MSAAVSLPTLIGDGEPCNLPRAIDGFGLSLLGAIGGDFVRGGVSWAFPLDGLTRGVQLLDAAGLPRLGPGPDQLDSPLAALLATKAIRPRNRRSRCLLALPCWRMATFSSSASQSHMRGAIRCLAASAASSCTLDADASASATIR